MLIHSVLFHFLGMYNLYILLFLFFSVSILKGVCNTHTQLISIFFLLSTREGSFAVWLWSHVHVPRVYNNSESNSYVWLRLVARFDSFEIRKQKIKKTFVIKQTNNHHKECAIINKWKYDACSKWMRSTNAP